MKQSEAYMSDLNCLENCRTGLESSVRDALGILSVPLQAGLEFECIQFSLGRQIHLNKQEFCQQTHSLHLKSSMTSCM